MTRPECGTMRGYRIHCKLNEPRCEPCRLARRVDETGLDQQPMNADELVAEIEWLLRLNQGRGTIVHQLGYTGRETSLERRLQRAHRGDLIQALLRDDKAAA
jgi:hypothetical protein